MTKRALIQYKFDGKCAYCGKDLSEKGCTLDHIIPKSRGGYKTEDNLYPACRKCNERKADLSMEDFRKAMGVELFYFEQKALRERGILERWREINAH